MSCYCRQKTEY